MVLHRPIESAPRGRHTEELTEDPYLGQRLESRWMVKLVG